MLLILLALVWLALLTPVVVRKVRDFRADRSIDHFHEEHEVLSRQGYSVVPAHRLEDGLDEVRDVAPSRRTRLTLVHPDDTYRSIESRTTWDEWSDDYDFERDANAPVAVTAGDGANHYARAYAARPSAPVVVGYEPPLRRRSMRTQRRRLTLSLLGAAVLVTGLAFVAGSSLIDDLAYVAWLLVVSYAALALYAVSQGYLSTTFTLTSASRYPVYEDQFDEPEWSYDESAVNEASGFDADFEEWGHEWYEPAPRAASAGGRRAFG